VGGNGSALWSCSRRDGREGTKRIAELVGAGESLFDGSVGLVPDWDCGGKQSSPRGGESKLTGSPVFRVRCDREQAAALQGLECGRQGGAIHRQKSGDGAHGRGDGAVETHEQGELAAGEVERAEGVVETPGERTGGALDVEAEAAVADQECGRS
jgi:hypothetical protein